MVDLLNVPIDGERLGYIPGAVLIKTDIAG